MDLGKIDVCCLVVALTNLKWCIKDLCIHPLYSRYTTLSYRAPEMVNLYNNKIITTKADVWVSDEKLVR